MHLTASSVDADPCHKVARKRCVLPVALVDVLAAAPRNVLIPQHLRPRALQLQADPAFCLPPGAPRTARTCAGRATSSLGCPLRRLAVVLGRGLCYMVAVVRWRDLMLHGSGRRHPSVRGLLLGWLAGPTRMLRGSGKPSWSAKTFSASGHCRRPEPCELEVGLCSRWVEILLQVALETCYR